MSCEAPERETLTFLAAGTLEPAEKARAAAHLQTCAACQAEWPSLRAWVEGLRSLHLESEEIVQAARGDAHPHLADCAQCRSEVALLKAVDADLGRRTPRAVSQWGQWALAASAALVAVAAWLLLQKTPAQPRPTAQPTVAPVSAPSASPAVARAEELERLARVDPPQLEAGVLRGEDGPEAFAAALGLYRRSDYAAAARAFETLRRRQPESVAVAFFLSVSQLLGGDTDRAVPGLRRVADLNDARYSEPSRFLLAKALLRGGDVAGARSELQRVVSADGDYRTPASELLEALSRLEAKR